MYRKRSNEWVRHLDFEIGDLLIMEIIYWIISHYRHNMIFKDILIESVPEIMVYFVVLDIVVIFFTHPYKNIIQRGYWKEFTSVFRLVTWIHVLLVLWYYMMHSSNELPRLSVGLSWLASIIIITFSHIIYKYYIRKVLENKTSVNLMFVVSDSKNVVKTLEQITTKKYNRYKICAIALMDDPDADFLNSGCLPKYIPVLSNKEDIHEYLRQQVVDCVFLDRTNLSYDWDNLTANLLQMGVTVMIGIADEVMKFPNAEVYHLGERPVVITYMAKADSWQLSVKRLMDICGALVGLVLTGIACIFIVPAIKIADPGPVFFSQKRVGTNGRVFNFYKFRSMYMDAEARKAELMSQNQMQGLMFKIENDPRIIGSEKGPGKGLGNFIRKTSLDELPQFWNILKGDMSLVGTRPPTLGEYEQYEPRYKVRLCMKPGLTGMWQVSGRSDITDFEEVVKLDTKYIENWNLGLDIKILLKTVLVVLHMSGSR